MDFENENEALAAAYKLIGSLFISEPDSSLVRDFQTAFAVDLASSLEEISNDFEEIFSPSQKRILPYESSYIGQTDFSMVASGLTERIYSFYLQEGLILDESLNIAPDHISAELFFVSYLLDANRVASLKYFFEEHIVSWIPRFCDDLYDAAFTDFYQELAAITKDLILTEYEKLSA